MEFLLNLSYNYLWLGVTLGLVFLYYFQKERNKSFEKMIDKLSAAIDKLSDTLDKQATLLNTFNTRLTRVETMSEFMRDRTRQGAGKDA